MGLHAMKMALPHSPVPVQMVSEVSCVKKKYLFRVKVIHAVMVGPAKTITMTPSHASVLMDLKESGVKQDHHSPVTMIPAPMELHVSTMALSLSFVNVCLISQELSVRRLLLA